jgi:hypothetical protein
MESYVSEINVHAPLPKINYKSYIIIKYVHV